MKRRLGARTRAQDLAILAAGGETGWWDDSGHPAPWAEDFLDPDAGWSAGDAVARDDTPTDNDPVNPPF